MNLVLIAAILVAIATIIFFIRRKKIDRKPAISSFNEAQQKTHQTENRNVTLEEKFKAQQETSEIIDNLKRTDAIRPEGNQQRNLDRETGGLEAEEQKESSAKDVWDDRSEEVDRMGAIDQLGSSAKKSMIWRKKKEKLDEKKNDKAKNAAEHHNQKQTSGTKFDSRIGKQGGFMQMIQARQDRGDGGRGL